MNIFKKFFRVLCCKKKKSPFKEYTPTMIGRKIRALRSFKGISIQDLASGCGLSRQTLYVIERGITKMPQIGTLSAIADYFKYPLGDLINPKVDINDEYEGKN